MGRYGHFEMRVIHVQIIIFKCSKNGIDTSEQVLPPPLVGFNPLQLFEKLLAYKHNYF